MHRCTCSALTATLGNESPLQYWTPNHNNIHYAVAAVAACIMMECINYSCRPISSWRLVNFLQLEPCEGILGSFKIQSAKGNTIALVKARRGPGIDWSRCSSWSSRVKPWCIAAIAAQFMMLSTPWLFGGLVGWIWFGLGLVWLVDYTLTYLIFTHTHTYMLLYIYIYIII